MSELTVQKQFGRLLDRETWDTLREQCAVVVKSGFLPKGVDTPEKAIAIALKGMEMGLNFMAAFSGISIVNGKPVIEGQLMLAQILRLVPGAKVEFIERTDKICKLRALRPGSEWQEFTWTIEDARKAGLTEKPGPWKTFPRNMLQWRAVADMGRAVFPDAIMGSYLPDEMEHDAIDVTPKSNAKSVQDLLASPQEEPAPEPDKIKIIIEEFEKVGINEDRIKYELGATTLEDLSEYDMESLRKWLKEERLKAQKAQLAKPTPAL